MHLISIIIPVFNTRKYLTRCIESLLNQTYHDLEIIIVDDGSQEETAILCDELSTRDSRISVYHKRNEGVSVARNYGLDRVHGTFVGFVDSDDWINYSMYQCLYDKAIETGADIVFCDAQTIYSDDRVENDTWDCFTESKILEVETIKPKDLCLMAGSACRGLYKSSVIKNNRFPEGLKFSEDRFFNLKCISVSKTISYLKVPYYYRFMRADSCVNSYHPDAVSTIRKASELINTFVVEHFGDSYLEAYERQPLGLALQSFYGVFASKHSFWGKYQEIKQIASDDFLQGIVQKLKPTDIRLRLMRYKLYFPLFMLMWCHNKTKQQ